jgi:hypothetical protein
MVALNYSEPEGLRNDFKDLDAEMKRLVLITRACAGLDLPEDIPTGAVARLVESAKFAREVLIRENDMLGEAHICFGCRARPDNTCGDDCALANLQLSLSLFGVKP